MVIMSHPNNIQFLISGIMLGCRLQSLATDLIESGDVVRNK